MKFYKNQLFHIFNQGNNKEKIFYTADNYEYFLWKMRAYLLPFGDLICWCLMPNHFHWQFFVKEIEIKRKILRTSVDELEHIRRVRKYGAKAILVNNAADRMAKAESFVTLNEAIGTLERSYARAINKQLGRTGSLFRKECKAKDGWINEFVTLEKRNGQEDYRFLSGTNYGLYCFNYIHYNPVEADMVKLITGYPYSSAKDYACLRNGTLCNLNLGRELMNFR